MKTDLYNLEQDRPATAAEIARYLVIDQLEMLIAINEKNGCEKLTDAEVDEIARHYEKHLRAIRKRMDPTNKIGRK